jgi:hypothetical protein
MTQEKRGGWRIIYRAYGQIKETSLMTKREAKDYYSMARCNCMLGHWQWVQIVRVKEEYRQENAKPLAAQNLLSVVNLRNARQLADLKKTLESGPAVAT